jgi:predicted GH43/DUF377 family glycosyl hydrolase
MKSSGHVSIMTKVASVVLASLFLAIAMPHPIFGFVVPPLADSVPDDAVQHNTTSLIESLIFNLDKGLIEKHLQRLQDYKTRLSYRGDKCFEASEYMASVFSQNGLNVTYDDFLYQGNSMRNVIGQKTGTTSPGEVFIICSHYDSISNTQSWSYAPGADDNGSGTAAVLAAAEVLSDYNFNSTIRFIGFGGEEQGLKGSYHYVGDLLAANESVSGVINMDMIATNPGTTLVNLFTGVAPIIDSTSLISETINTTIEYGDIIGIQISQAGASGSSDHYPFARYFKSIMLLERTFSSNYHTGGDTIDKLNLTYCANVTQITVATIAKLAQIIPGDMSPPAHTDGYPRNNTYSTALPTISIEITDPSLLNLTSLELCVAGSIVTPILTPISLGYNVSFTPPTPFSDGQIVNLSIFAEDIQGSGFNHSWKFVVDALPPQPPTNFTIMASRVELIKRGLVINNDSPSDSKHALAPSVIFYGGEYKMWYGANNGSFYHVCYANSTNGLNWTKHGVVLYRGATGQPDSQYATYPAVIYDGEYKMWYTGYNGVNCRIMYANSSNGIDWVKRGVAIGNGLSGEMDSLLAYYPTVLKTTEYKMWYSGLDGMRYRILYANSTDGLNWTKHNTDTTPIGIGDFYGDGMSTGPEVVFHNNTYHMYYSRNDGTSSKTVRATSIDGLKWNDIGLAVDTGKTGEYDNIRAEQCSVIMTGNETKVWYSAFNSANWRILFANITKNNPAKDLTLRWAPSASPDVVRYEIFRESRPSAFKYPLEIAHPELYVPPTDITSWTFETGYAQNLSVYGPVTGSDPPFFYLPDDNIKNINIYLKSSIGGWQKLVPGTDYAIDIVVGHVEIYSTQFTAGCTLYASYNHSAGKALRMQGNCMADVRAGLDSNKSYYYVIRAVDRAGNYAYCTEMPVKIGTAISASWNLICNPYIQGSVPVSEALAGLGWTAARTWDPSKEPNHWTSNIPGRPDPLNSLQMLDSSVGVWVKASATGAYAALGHVSNTTINLVAGWNLVTYPYNEIKSVSQALAGIPWDSVASYNPASPNLLTELAGNDWLGPGRGFWVRVTSDTVWNAVNMP